MHPKRSDNFDKFSKKKKGSAVKEQFRQDKKKAKLEMRAAGEAFRQRKKEWAQNSPTSNANKNRVKKTSPSIAKVNSSPEASFEQMPLNKYIAHAGVSGRREAASIVKAGQVTVNGDIVLEPGYKVKHKDVVRLKGKVLQRQVTPVYILLNKPKDFICTASDPEGRKTVLDIVKNATTARVFPVGRLDRNTTGVLLLTNDGDLSQKLTHPSYEIKKIYEVTLDKPVSKADMETIAVGIELEDGFIAADAVSYLSNTSKNVIGIEIHSGRNRIVRRIFEYLGYDVRQLDRVMFAGLTKKNVDRGKWRFLSEKEVRLLKFLNASFTRKSSH